MKLFILLQTNLIRVFGICLKRIREHVVRKQANRPSEPKWKKKDLLAEEFFSQQEYYA